MDSLLEIIELINSDKESSREIKKCLVKLDMCLNINYSQSIMIFINMHNETIISVIFFFLLNNASISQRRVPFPWIWKRKNAYQVHSMFQPRYITQCRCFNPWSLDFMVYRSYSRQIIINNKRPLRKRNRTTNLFDQKLRLPKNQTFLV